MGNDRGDAETLSHDWEDPNLPAADAELLRAMFESAAAPLPQSARDQAWTRLQARLQPLPTSKRGTDSTLRLNMLARRMRLSAAHAPNLSSIPWGRALASVAIVAVAALAIAGSISIFRWEREDSRIAHGLLPATSRCETNAGAASAGSPIPVSQSVPAQGMPRLTPVASQVSTPSVPAARVDFQWETTGAAGGFENVAGMAVDTRCRLWVVDQNNGRFQIFSLGGSLLETWGGPGAGDGEFNFVVGGVKTESGAGAGAIAFASDGGFYVLDSGNHRVQQFDHERGFVRSWGTEGASDGEFSHPIGLLVAKDGNVYVLDIGRADVQVFSSAGLFLYIVGSPNVGPGHLTEPNAIALAPDGNLWISDPSTGLLGFAPNGETIATLPFSSSTNGLAIDRDGNFYCSGSNRVSVFDRNGALKYYWGELGLGRGQFLEMSSVVLDGSGGVYVGEVDNQRIQKFQIRDAR